MKSPNPLGGSEVFYRFIRVVLFAIYRAWFRFEYFGAEKTPDGRDGRGLILAPNHASYLDPPLLGISLRRRVTYLAKEYLFKHWFVGRVLRGIGAYPIKSETGNDFRSVRDLVRILKQGACVTVFPEGTRSENGQLKEPESGIGFLAMKSQAWVMPVYIEGTYQAFPKGAKKIKAFPVRVWFGDPFLPAEEAGAFGSGEAAYAAVSQKIMADIKILKDKAGVKRVATGSEHKKQVSV